MAIRKFRTGQMSYAVGTYVGTAGTLFYDEANGALRISDGVTPGGSLISYPIASSTQIGGIKLGPGVVLNNDNQIIIDSEGLDFSFGDLAATIGTYTDSTVYAVLSSINANEDMVLASNGSGSVHVIGEFKVHSTNGSLTETLESTPAFTVQADGQVIIHVTQGDVQLGAVEIIGSSTGDVVPPGINGTMLHITGQIEDPCRVYIDGNGDYVSLVARRWNGNFTDGRTAVLANDYVLRINATAQTDAGMGNVAMAQISIQALENQTATAQGSKITFTVTPIGSAASARVDVANITVADGVSATKFTGPLTGNVTGNVSGSAATLTTARNINGVSFNGSADITVTAAAGTLTGNTLASEVTASSLTSVGTLTNLAIASNGTITTPRVVINDGGIRTISGGTTCTINFATDSIILWTAPTGTAVITLSNYTAGAQVKLIIAMTTSRDVTYGISSAANSSTGLDNWNGSGAGDIPLTNTAMHLEYTCISALAAGCYVAVTASE
jgi:hypothetical protein